ncbi:HAMP domain-containing sensor histidine kinase [Permianibacter aggregans]|uniref:histidine kinase n=1 Tax=Permianibacter aggregans TaxID=1510150 RepID=A0A4R6UGF0_9GAMM|nr:HAMP domain-containing sensor histidine kinase [Permianibacter aggregans]QGX38516.1 HAMP domain-containing histidine kinase [Permianibacter aggregans]TDQ45076.1 signal transduction histidine kinase [Permianibacter aggregans]
MSMRSALFLIMAALLSLLMGLQWWQHQQQSQQLAAALARTSFLVTRDTLEAVLFNPVLEPYGLASPALEMHLIADQRGQVLRIASAETVTDIRIDDQAVQQLLDQSTRQRNLWTMSLMFAALIVLALLTHGITRPLQRLRSRAADVARGELGAQIEPSQHFITELTQTHRAFNAMSSQLQTLAEENEKHRQTKNLQEFVDIARSFAHALRNPLNALGLATDELTETNLADDRRQRLHQVCQRQIAHIDHWVKAMLDAGLAQHDQTEAHEPQTLLQQAIAATGIEADRFRLQISENLPALHCRPKEVINLFSVLLSNAVEASDADAPIDISLDSKDDLLRVTIRDQGKGIEPAIHERLFEPHNTSKAQGAGMGLYLSRRMARGLYDGELEIVNNAERGTTAILTLKSRSST